MTPELKNFVEKLLSLFPQNGKKIVLTAKGKEVVVKDEAGGKIVDAAVVFDNKPATYTLTIGETGEIASEVEEAVLTAAPKPKRDGRSALPEPYKKKYM